MRNKIILISALLLFFAVSLLFYLDYYCLLNSDGLSWKYKEQEIRSRLLSIPILLYHNIDGKGPFSIDLPVLRSHFQLIKDKNIRVIKLSALIDRLENPEPFTGKVIVITFDDGYYSMYSKLLPLVREFKYPVTLFVYTDYIYTRSSTNLTWDKLQYLSDQGIDIQCHSITHHDFVKNKGTNYLYNKFLYDELYLSKRIIELYTGKKISYFAYPYGSYDLGIINRSENAGYDRVFSTDYGPNIITRDNFCLRRQHIKKNYSLEFFGSLIE